MSERLGPDRDRPFHGPLFPDFMAGSFLLPAHRAMPPLRMSRATRAPSKGLSSLSQRDYALASFRRPVDPEGV